MGVLSVPCTRAFGSAPTLFSPLCCCCCCCSAPSVCTAAAAACFTESAEPPGVPGRLLGVNDMVSNAVPSGRTHFFSFPPFFVDVLAAAAAEEDVNEGLKSFATSKNSSSLTTVAGYEGAGEEEEDEDEEDKTEEVVAAATAAAAAAGGIAATGLPSRV